MHLFDLDHTLLKGNSSFHFGKYLYRQRFFSFWKLVGGLWDYARHKYFGLSVKTLHANSFSRFFKGHPLSTIHFHVNHFLDEHLSSILNSPVVHRLKDAQKRGDNVGIISSGPDFLVESIAKRLNIREWQATKYLVDNQGIFSELAHVIEGADKASYVRELAKSLKISLSGVAVYSDSHLDLPVLQLVGKAVAVNPDRYLRRVCQKNGWEVINAEYE